MPLGWRFGIAFILPIFLATILWFGTEPVRNVLQSGSAEFLTLFASNEPAALSKLIEKGSVLGEKAEFLKWVTRAVIVLGMGVVGFLIPRNATSRTLVNLLSAAILGFCLVKLMAGFPAVTWHGFALSAVAGSVGALYVAVIRSRRALLRAD